MKKITLLCICMLFVSCIFAQHTITIQLTTDNYGSETTWQVTDITTGTSLASGGPYSNASVAQTISPISVDGTGCYFFTIFDSYGDGMQAGYGTGSYTVSYDGVQMASGGSFGSSMTHYVGGDGCPANEIAIQALTPSVAYCQLSNTFTITGSVLNNGTSLTSFNVTYKIDNGSYVADYNVTCNASILETVNFTHNIPASFTTEGTHTITVMVSNPNGATDDVTDNTATQSVIVYSNAVQRKVLLEHFTTAQCPNCPAAIANLKIWTNARPNIIWMSHHAGYYTDEYTIPENTSMCAFYNAGGNTYAPAIMLDRALIEELGEPGPVFFPSASYTPNVMDDRLATPAFVSLEMTGTISADNIVNVTVSGEIVAELPYANLRLSLYIIEEGLTGTQAGGGANFAHDHVVRDAISGTFGDENVITSTTSGSTFSKTYTFSINENEWVPENCRLVAFVNNQDPNDINNREVMNAEIMSITDLTTGIDENNWNNFVIYPNPTTEVLHVSCVNMNQVEVINALGQVVYTNNVVENDLQINVSNLTNGIYFIRLTGDKGVTTKKFIKE